MKMESEYQSSTLSTMVEPIIILENHDHYYQPDQYYYSNEQFISNDQYYQTGQYYPNESYSSNEQYFQSESYYQNDQYYQQNTQWILENVGYQSEYEFQVKDVQTFIQNSNIFESEQLYSVNNEIAIIDPNYNQLFLHYENLQPSISDQSSYICNADLSFQTTNVYDNNNNTNNNDNDDDNKFSMENQQYAATAVETADSSNYTEFWDFDLENYDLNNNIILFDDNDDVSLNFSHLDSQINNFFANNNENNINEEQLVNFETKLTNEQEKSIKNKSTLSASTGNGRKAKNQGDSTSSSSASRIWYKCGWQGCSFGSFYNGVVKRHGHKRHSGKIKIDKSSNSTMHRFKCDWPGCDVSLVAYHKLVEHKRKHTGEKPFRCKWQSCNYATARLYSMIIHERTHKLDTLF